MPLSRWLYHSRCHCTEIFSCHAVTEAVAVVLAGCFCHCTTSQQSRRKKEKKKKKKKKRKENFCLCYYSP
jgi:hypothetical protein